MTLPFNFDAFWVGFAFGGFICALFNVWLIDSEGAAKIKRPWPALFFLSLTFITNSFVTAVIFGLIGGYLKS